MLAGLIAAVIVLAIGYGFYRAFGWLIKRAAESQEWWR